MANFSFRQGLAGAAAGMSNVLGGLIQTEIGKRAQVDLTKLRGEMEALRDEREAERREQSAIRVEARKRAPFEEAHAATERWRAENPSYAADVPGIATEIMPSEGETNARLRQELLRRGEHSAAHDLAREGLERERLESTRASTARREAQDERQHEERMAILQKQLNVQERMLARQYGLDKNASTALTTNIKFLVDQGIAKTPAEAFEKLHTRMDRSAEETMRQMVLGLLRSGDPRYRGKDGRQNALDDARAVVGRIRRADERAFERGFQNAQPGAGRRPLDSFLMGE
jgi:hypothetical protein